MPRLVSPTGRLLRKALLSPIGSPRECVCMCVCAGAEGERGPALPSVCSSPAQERGVPVKVLGLVPGLAVRAAASMRMGEPECGERWGQAGWRLAACPL